MRRRDVLMMGTAGLVVLSVGLFGPCGGALALMGVLVALMGASALVYGVGRVWYKARNDALIAAVRRLRSPRRK